MDLKVIFAFEAFGAEIADAFLTDAVVVQDVIVERLEVLRDERALLTFEITLT
jgi:hypothetical protein